MITTFATTLEQRQAAKAAALERYEFNKNTPDRPGWQGGKCPVSEFRAIMAEIGAANALGYDWHQLCLYSTDPSDFTRPDIGDWEVKAGSTFGKKDITKGAKYIIWVNPWAVPGNGFYCGYKTCGARYHLRYADQVEVLGWTDLTEDLTLCADFGMYYKPTGEAMRNASTLPVLDWGL